MPRAKRELRQISLPWGPAPGRAPVARSVWHTASQEERDAFAGVFDQAEVERLRRLGFSDHLIGVTRDVAFTRFRGLEQLRHRAVRRGMVREFTYPLKGSAWPRKDGGG